MKIIAYIAILGGVNMKLNTHDTTPKTQSSKTANILLMISAVLMYSMFGLVAFCCLYYAKSFAGGMMVIIIPVLFTVSLLIHFKDMEKAYVEIKENEFCVVDYYWGIKKEKHIPKAKVTSAEVCLGYSLKVKGYRWSALGFRYIVFRNGKKYLFKIVYLPETEKLFKEYIK